MARKKGGDTTTPPYECFVLCAVFPRNGSFAGLVGLRIDKRPASMLYCDCPTNHNTTLQRGSFCMIYFSIILIGSQGGVSLGYS